MQTYMLTNTGKVEVELVSTFEMAGVPLAVVDASCGGRYPDRCQAITCEASLLVMGPSDDESEALAATVEDIYSRTHEAQLVEYIGTFARWSALVGETS